MGLVEVWGNCFHFVWVGRFWGIAMLVDIMVSYCLVSGC